MVVDGVGDEAVFSGGGGDAAPVSQSSPAAATPPPDGGMGAVETMVMLGLSRMP